MDTNRRWRHVRRVWVLALAAWCVALAWIHGRDELLARSDPGRLELQLRFSSTGTDLATVSLVATGGARRTLSAAPRPGPSSVPGARWTVIGESLAEDRRTATVDGALAFGSKEPSPRSVGSDAPRAIAGLTLLPPEWRPPRGTSISVSVGLPAELSALWVDAAGARGPMAGGGAEAVLPVSTMEELASGALVVGPAWRRASPAGPEERIVVSSRGLAEEELSAATLRWSAELDRLVAGHGRRSVIVVEDPPERPPGLALHGRRYAVLPVANAGPAARERFLEELCLARLADLPRLPTEHAWLDPALARRAALALLAPELEQRRWRELLAYCVFLASSYEAPMTELESAQGRAREYLSRTKGPLLLRSAEIAASDGRAAPELARAWLDVRAAVAGGEAPEDAAAHAFGPAAKGVLAHPAGAPAPGLLGEVPELRPRLEPAPPSAVRLTLAVTADTESFLESCGCRLRQAGGIARRARVVGRVAEEGPSLALDLGNVLPRIDPAAVDEVTLGEARTQLAAHRRMGYALQVLGPNELYAGIDRLSGLADPERPAFHACNASLASGGDPPWSREPLELELAGTKLRILPLAPTSSYWIDPDELRRRTAWVEIEDPVDAARRICAEAAADELLIVAGSLPTWRIPELLAAAPQIDLVVSSDRWTTAASGGTKRPQQPWFLASGFLGETLVVLANEEGHGLSLVRMELAATGRVASFSQEDVVLSPELEEDLGVRSLLDDFYAKLELRDPDPERASPLVVLEAERELLARGAAAQGEYVGSAACRACHAEEYARWKASPHAHAYETLESKHRARSAGCVRCHVVGYGLPGGFSLADPRGTADLRGVGCEVCHGPGRAHALERPGDASAIRRRFEQAQCELCHDPEHSEPLSGRAVDPFVLGAHRADAGSLELGYPGSRR